jgi:hypothetical protein
VNQLVDLWLNGRVDVDSFANVEGREARERFELGEERPIRLLAIEVAGVSLSLKKSRCGHGGWTDAVQLDDRTVQR